MNYLEKWIGICSKIPDFAALLICPALLFLVALLLFSFGGRKFYPPLAIVLGGIGMFLVFCKDVSSSFGYCFLFTAFAGLLSLIFFLPTGKRGRKENHAQEEMYKKFAQPLEISYDEPTEEEEACYDREESGLRLGHTLDLLDRLKKTELEASDRLEADALSHTLESYREKELTAEEMRSLNDCLATVLKLTAKYKL